MLHSVLWTAPTSAIVWDQSVECSNPIAREGLNAKQEDENRECSRLRPRNSPTLEVHQKKIGAVWKTTPK
jgi:hypothetical protein